MDGPSNGDKDMPATHYKLAPHWHKFIAEQIKFGEYADASEVVEAGLSALEREQESFKLFIDGVSKWPRPDYPSSP
jgi:putative addiction module CopG family antidote